MLDSHPGKRTQHWSKGVPVSDATRRKISLSQKRRWKEKGSELRATVSVKLSVSVQDLHANGSNTIVLVPQHKPGQHFWRCSSLTQNF